MNSFDHALQEVICKHKENRGNTQAINVKIKRQEGLTRRVICRYTKRGSKNYPSGLKCYISYETPNNKGIGNKLFLREDIEERDTVIVVPENYQTNQ